MTVDMILAAVDRMRREAGLLTIAEVLALAGRGNVVLDPFSVLIARAAVIGADNRFHPGVALLVGPGGRLAIGDGNLFHTGTSIEAQEGEIAIGSGNAFGEGGFTARANRPGARIAIGDGGRYQRGAVVTGATTLGSGSQILGAVAVDGCTLAPGASHADPDPDRRGAVLKGWGTARGLSIPAGHVIAGAGRFRAEDMKTQSHFHPKPQIAP